MGRRYSISCIVCWLLQRSVLPIGTNFLFVTIFRQWEYTNSSPSSNNNSGIMCISSALPL